MKMSEVKALSLEEVHGKVAAEKENLKKMKFAHAISPIENPMKIRVSRKVIAQLETELRSRQLAK